MIKANCFGSHATRRTSDLEKASADWWPSRYKGDEVVVMIKRYKEKLIVVAKKMELRYLRF